MGSRVDDGTTERLSQDRETRRSAKYERVQPTVSPKRSANALGSCQEPVARMNQSRSRKAHTAVAVTEHARVCDHRILLQREKSFLRAG